MIHVNVPLTLEEQRALVAAAERHCRHPREEARWMLHTMLRVLGWLQPDDAEAVKPAMAAWATGKKGE